MESTVTAERISVVPDIDPVQDRIDALVEELERHQPPITLERLAAAAGLSYQTWRNLLTRKKVRDGTLERFEQALADLVAHPEDVAEEPAHIVLSERTDLIEIDLDISGDFGVHATAVVKGPVSNPDAVAEAAAKILEKIRSQRTQGKDQ